MPEELEQQTDNFVQEVTEHAGGIEKPAETKPTTESTPPNDELRKAMAELAGTVKTLATPKEQPKELTEAEKAQFWGIYDPTAGGAKKDFFQKWFRLNPDATPQEIDEAKEMFADVHKGIVRQAMIGARNLFQEELAKLREEFTPAAEFAQQARAEKTRERFFKSYPALYNENEQGSNQFAKVIDATARLLADKEFDDEASYFKALAEGAAETIKTVLPSFDIGAKPQKQPAGTTPKLPRTRVGGTGGTATTTSASRKNGSDDDSDAIDW